MESNAFGSSHIPSQALVVLSEAASGLHEALRGQRPFPSRLPDAKDLHNMSLVGSYGSHLLHSFHPHLLQTLNHNMLAANGTAAAASYFASERAALGKPSVLGNFQLPSAFSPPKYIGISLDQNLFNGSDSFRTDSASPTCTSHESLEGSNDYDGEKGESPRSNTSDPRDLRHNHRSDKPSTSCASSMAAVSAAAAAAVASIASSQAAAAASSATVSSHMAAHHPHHPHAPPPHHVPHHLPPLSAHHHHHHPNSSLLAAASMSHSLGLGGPPGLRPPPGHVPDMCPVCGIKLSADEWNSHFLTELDRLYKLSSGMERTNLQATYMFAQPCPSQENAIRTSHNRWETFQRIRNNRQNRLRIKVRKRKYGDMYFMENMFCNSCPICKRKYALETGGKLPDEDNKQQDEIETVDVESCNDDVPDSNSEMSQVHHAHMPALSGSSSHSSSHSSSNGGGSNTPGGANLHNSNSQPGKLDGILYRTANCVISKDNVHQAAEEDVSTNVATTTTASGSNSSNSSSAGSTTNWTEVHNQGNNNHGNASQGHISVKNVSELSSTTHHYYNADSCNEERTAKDMSMDTCNNDSDEDVIVDDDDSIKMSSYNKKRKYEEAMVGSSRISDNPSPVEERPRSEPQVTSTESSVENPHNNNNNTKYTAFEDLRSKHLSHHSQQQQQHQMTTHHQLERDSPNGHGQGVPPPLPPSSHAGLMPGLTQQHLDSKVGNSSDIKPDIDDDNKCFICKTGIKDFASDTLLRGRNFYFHQSCANVMSSYRLNKEMQQQQQQQQHQQQTEVGSTDKSPSSQNQQPQPTSQQQQHVDNSMATHKES
ncbi:teyrha-meyrha isoform X2 [Musca autumnalis]|uniref:teyrha-meyrha isoform X2 n=1 Tax=Musca autumnalis TaxID=221902 RepID=UPI003CF8787C